MESILATSESGRSGRIRAVREHLALSQADVASRFGVAQQTWANYERGERNPPLDLLTRIGVTESIDLHWLLTGEGALRRTERAAVKTEARAMQRQIEALQRELENQSSLPGLLGVDDELIRVPILENPAGAGPGGAGGGEIRAYGRFWRRWLETVVKVEPESAFIVPVFGDSMTDFLFDGDLVLGQVCPEIDRDGTWVVSYDGELLIKHVERPRAKRRLTLKSENPRFPDITVESGVPFDVVGRFMRRITK